MYQAIIISLITLIFTSCNINREVPNISQSNFDQKNNNFYAANYLSANYLIKNGDVYTASQILNKRMQNDKLLEIKFFSNLVSGKFNTADIVAKKLKNNNKTNILYDLPKYILKIKDNNFKESLQLFKDQKLFFNVGNLNDLMKLWIEETENKKDYLSERHYFNTSIHKLLILENFHNSNKLIRIADAIYEGKNLNSLESLFLAGFYFRVDNFERSKEIINTKLSNQFDKNSIISNFSNVNNMFSKLQKLKTILASKLYNFVNKNNEKISKFYLYQKILLEFSLFLEPRLDISKYALAEIYNSEKISKVAIEKLESIPDRSFFSLAANLKKLSIIKSFEIDIKYKSSLEKVVDLWPKNKLVLYRLASYYKSKKQFYKSIKIYKDILDQHKYNDRDIFLYASNLDKIGKWKQAKVLFLQLLKKNPEDTYTLNYVSYKLALKNQELDLALDLIEKALIIDPNNGYFLDTLGWVEFKRKNYNSAVFFLEKSVSILPRSAEVIDHLGDCYLLLDRKREALFEWKKALKYETDESIVEKIKDKIRKYEHLL